ncbi:MAG: tetratricopeptide repeat protein [candidate division Zixibacteria bacterium]|nr:tetratricopeptide repeat protein [candidate division Zixibacteria bacterium]
MPTGVVDTLEAELKTLAERGEETPRRVHCLLDLGEAVVIDEPHRGAELMREALEMAQRIGYQPGIAMGLGYLGWAEYSRSDLDSALTHLQEARALLQDSDDRHGYARTLMGLAGVHRSLGNVEHAYATSLEALKIFRDECDLINEAWTLYGLAGGHTDAGDLDRALDDFNACLRLFAEAERRQPVRDAILGRARALNGIGGVYQMRGEYDQALQYHHDSLVIFRNEGAALGEARALDDMGAIYQRQERYAEALECHNDSLRLREQVGNRQAQSTSLINLGTLYTRMGRLDDAIDVLQRALTIAQDVKSRPKEFQAHEALSRAYQNAGDLANALDHHEMFHRVRDAVVGDQTKARVRNLQIAYAVESAEQQAEIERLRNVELKETNERLEQLLNELREAQVQLIHTEKMASLGQLVSTLVHEFNTPLGTIDSALDIYSRTVANTESLVDSSSSIEELRGSDRYRRTISAMHENRDVARAAIERMTKLVRSLKSFVRLDEATTQFVDIRQGLDDTLTLLQPEFSDRIRLTTEYDTCPPVTGNPGELNQVFMNLIANAVQAIDGTGSITVRTFANDGYVHVEIADSGVGIPAEQVRQLFDPSFSKRGSRIKAGLGLFTSYNIVQKHGGEIRVESEVGKGSRFTVVLPVRQG